MEEGASQDASMGEDGSCRRAERQVRERARALKALARRVWATETLATSGAAQQTQIPSAEGAGAVLAFVAPLLLPPSEPHLLHLIWTRKFAAVTALEGSGHVKANANVGGGNEDGDHHIEEAGRLLDFAVGWVAAFPEDFKGDHPVIEQMADQARRWQEAMRSRADIKQGVRAGRLVLRLEAAKVSTLAYAGGGDRMQSLLMRAGSHLRNVAAAQAASGRRRSLRVLVRQQATISAASLQQSASAHPVQQPGPPQHQSLPDLCTSGPLTPRPSEYQMDFMAFDAGAIARELTLIEFGLFYNIRPRELLNQAWQREDKEKKAPNVSLLIARFNEVAFWIATEILQTQGSKMQTVVIKKVPLVDVASQCYDMGNFNTLMEIISGLAHSSVKRLKTAWKGLGDRHQRRFDELEQLMSPRNNFNDYRELLKKRTLEQAEKERERREKKTSKMVSVPPILPYFALLLRDLTFINENPKYLAKDHASPRESESESENESESESESDDHADEYEIVDSGGDDSQDESGSSRRKRTPARKGRGEEEGEELEVNWDLMVMLNQVRQVIQQYQRINYAYAPNHELRRVLTNLQFISDENELWKLSQLSFSATSEKKTHRRSLSAPLKMKLEALLQHDDRNKNRTAARETKECVMSDEEARGGCGIESGMLDSVDAEEEWERGSTSSVATRREPPTSPPWRSSTGRSDGAEGQVVEEETPSRRKRKQAAAAAAAAGTANREEAPRSRWEGSKKKAESMWDQFLHRYFSSHIPSNRENTDSWRFYQSLTSGMDDQLRESNEALRSKINGRAGVRSGLSRSEQPKSSTTSTTTAATTSSSSSNKFKQIADDVKTRQHNGNANGDAGGGKQRGGSGDFFQHLSGGAREMLEKTVNDSDLGGGGGDDRPQQPRRERAATTTDVVTSTTSSSSSSSPSSVMSTAAMPRSHSSGEQQRREGSFILFENLGVGAQAMLKRDDVLPPTTPSPTTPRKPSPSSSPSSSSSSPAPPLSPRSSSSSSGAKSPRSAANGSSASLPVRKGRAHRTSLATATSEFLVAQRTEGAAD